MEYTYKPYIVKTQVKKKFINKAYRVLFRTDDLDFKDQNRCFFANYTQHHDAFLVYQIYKLIVAMSIPFPFFSIHDRFGCHPF